MIDKILSEASRALSSLEAYALVACYAEEFLFEDASSGHRIMDKGRLLENYQQLFSSPGVRFSDIEFFSAGDRAAGEWTWSGISSRDGQRFSIKGASIFQIQEGRIVREVIYYDPRPAL
ncbi:MAG: nuclear transport factor 2 family protein [Candidatus Promineifilaceae bacterium]|jgi:ketosteroid isomerase-like protein